MLDTTNELNALKGWIKAQAKALGFADCGFVHPTNPIFVKQLGALQTWLAQGKHGDMLFFEEKSLLEGQLLHGSGSEVAMRS